MSYASGHVVDCQFLDIGRTGVTTYSPAQNFSIVGCQFSRCWEAFYFRQTPNATLMNCTVEDNLSVGQFDLSSGRMIGNVVASAEYGGVTVYGAGSVLVQDNFINTRGVNVFAAQGADNLLCLGNVLEGSTQAAVYLANCAPRFSENNISRGEGYAVKLEGFTSSPARHVDMRNNYWGTTVTDSIAAWVFDGEDPIDYHLYGYVDYLPFSSNPVSEKQESFGAVKSMFR